MDERRKKTKKNCSISDQVQMFKSNDSFIRNLTQFYRYYPRYFFNDYFVQLFGVNNQEEFKFNHYILDNKRINGFNSMITELNYYYQNFDCELKSDLVIFNQGANYQEGMKNQSNSENLRTCKFLREPLKILSPFGKCLTYLYRLNELNLSVNLNQYFLFFEENFFQIFCDNKFKAINRRFIIHSQDVLPIMINNDLFFTETTVNIKNGFLIKLTKYEFERLPKPYDTNCQMYGNSTRFQCLNECYFDGYMNSVIKCIPNSESLYTFVIEGDVENQRKIFCESEDKNSVNHLNKNITENCNKKCLHSCDDTYFTTDYEEIFSTSGSEAKGPIYKFHLGDIYFKRMKYSAKITFFALIISIANIWSLWHGITFQQLFELFINCFKIEKIINFLSLTITKIIIVLKLAKILMVLTQIKSEIKHHLGKNQYQGNNFFILFFNLITY